MGTPTRDILKNANAAQRAAIIKQTKPALGFVPQSSCTAAFFEFEMHTISVANARENRFDKAKRVQRERQTVAVELRNKVVPLLPVTVTFKRFSHHTMDDDNLPSAFKAARDQIAEMYGVDDGKKDIEWKYGQDTGKPFVYVTITKRSAVAATEGTR